MTIQRKHAARRYATAVLVLASALLSGAWLPSSDYLDRTILTLFGAELRDTLMTPRQLALSCVKFFGGEVNYFESPKIGFRLTCTVGAMDGHDVTAQSFVFALSATKPIVVLVDITTAPSATSRPIRRLTPEERLNEIREIRDDLLNDSSFGLKIPDGHDAFGDYRICRTADDVNCVRKD